MQTLLSQMVRQGLMTHDAHQRHRNALHTRAGVAARADARASPLRRPQHSRFDLMSTTILQRIDDLGARLDELEAAVGDLSVAVRTQTLLA